jgi:putative ABC transport system permease protein
MQTTEDQVTARAAARDIRADRVVDATAGGFGPAVLDRIRALPGVAGATELVDSSGTVTPAGSEVALRGVSAEGLQRTIDLAPVAGSLDALRGDDAVALSTRQATAYGVHLGDPLPLRFGDGTRAAPHIVALYADGASPTREFVLLPAGVLAAHTTVGLPSRILVTAAPGAAGRQLDARLAEFASTIPGAEVAGRQAITADSTQIEQILASSNYTIVAMIVGYAAITVVNSLLAVTRKRRGEFGLQRLTGATRAQVLAMLGVEGALIAVIATVLGTAAAATTVVPYSLVRSGSPLPSGPIGLYPAIVAGALALILAATLVPCWRGMRGAAIDAASGQA